MNFFRDVLILRNCLKSYFFVFVIHVETEAIELSDQIVRFILYSIFFTYIY